MMRRRIVVALDAGVSPRELEAAAGLAGGAGAELVGLYVEDAELLRFAALPFALEIGVASAARLKLDVGAMERAMRGLADAAARMLESTAGQNAVPWSFRVVRGFAARELLRTAAEAFAGSAGDELRLLLLGDGNSPARRWAERAGGAPAGGEPALRVRIVHTMNLAELERALRADASGVLVLLVDPQVLSLPELHAILRATPAPVLLLPAARVR